MAQSTKVYFAYGSNMLCRRLRAPERAPSASVVGIGFVISHRLTFDKMSSDGSGKCDMEATGNRKDRTYGVLFEIDSAEKPALDRAEGRGKGYCEGSVQVVTASATREAITYLATSKEPALRPYHWYKALVIAGAVEHHLPESYVDWLRTFDSKADPKAERRRENESLLFGS